MTVNLKFIITVLLAVICTAVVVSMVDSCNAPRPALTSKSLDKRMKIENDSLKQANENITAKIEVLKAVMVHLHEQIGYNKEKIASIKQQQHEKIHIIDGYNSSELISFFSGVHTEADGSR